MTGQVLVAAAAFGVDHDLAQRFLVAKSPSRGALSVIASQFVAVVVVFMFLAIGCCCTSITATRGRRRGVAAGGREGAFTSGSS
jgi:uncharacterized membrane protein YbhN (UPF0104 family)